MMNVLIPLTFISTLLLVSCAHNPRGVEHWRAMAMEDLEFIRSTIELNHPGPLDTRNPAFAEWMLDGYDKSLHMQARVKGHGSYEHLLRHYVNGFADEHISLSFWLDYRWRLWAGIVMAWNGHHFIVHQSLEEIGLPRGSVLEQCDGRDSESLWRENIVSFYARPDMSADRYRHAPRMLLDNANPLAKRPQVCTFITNTQTSTTREVTLSWNYIGDDALQAKLALALPGSSDHLSIRKLGQNGAWLTIPTFSVGGQNAEQMRNVLAQLRDYRNMDFLVVDVRGNGGGSSYWGELFVTELFGEDYAKGFEHRRDLAIAEVSIDHRVSKDNVKHYESLERMVIEQAGENSEKHVKFRELVNGMRTTLEQGYDFYKLHVVTAEQELSTLAKPAFNGKLVFLADSICASACLDFADRLAALPNSVFVGQPTSADTNYMEIRDVSLPSGNGKLSFATKVYRGDRNRPESGYYTPDFLFIGDIRDTEAVERWIHEEVLQK